MTAKEPYTDFSAVSGLNHRAAQLAEPGTLDWMLGTRSHSILLEMALQYKASGSEKNPQTLRLDMAILYCFAR